MRIWNERYANNRRRVILIIGAELNYNLASRSKTFLISTIVIGCVKKIVERYYGQKQKASVPKALFFFSCYALLMFTKSSTMV